MAHMNVLGKAKMNYRYYLTFNVEINTLKPKKEFGLTKYKFWQVPKSDTQLWQVFVYILPLHENFWDDVFWTVENDICYNPFSFAT